MFVCRRRLFHPLRLSELLSPRIKHVSLLSTTNASIKSSPYSGGAGAVGILPLPVQSVTRQETVIDGTDPLPRFSIPQLLEVLTNIFEVDRRRTTPLECSPHHPHALTIRAYLSLRRRDRRLLASLPRGTFVHVVRQADREKLPSVVGIVIEDVLEIYDAPSVFEKSVAIRALLKVASSSPSILHEHVLSLFTSLPNPDPHPPLSPKIVVRVITALLAQSQSQIASSIPLLASVASLLANATEPSQKIVENEEAPDPPPQSCTWLTFRVLQIMLQLGEEERALDIFRALLQGGKIPADSVRDSDQRVGNFKVLIISTLVKACLRYGWWNGASELLCATSVGDDASWKPLWEAAAEVVAALLSTGNATDTENCGKTIIALTGNGRNIILPDHLVERFYNHSRRIGNVELGSKVYMHLQTPVVRAYHQYPPPQARTLMWLMSHFVDSNHIHSARILAQHVVDDETTLFPTIRPSFISTCASKGFTSQARALWERCSVGQYRDVVVGHAGTMLRVVAAFANRAQKSARRGAALARDNKGDVGSSVACKKNAEIGPPSQGGNDANRSEGDLEEEALTFAHRVISEFQLIKEPLQSASHMDINALARAQSIVGNFVECLEMLKIILGRFEVPDLHDINVILAAMARHQPRSAALMIERMIAKGIQPDPITFATVINEALVDQDTELVGRLLLKARSLGYDELTEKAVASLLHATLAATQRDVAEGETTRRYVYRAYDLINSLPQSSVIKTPNMGKKCIQAAMRADDPELAFKFWKLMIKEQTEWNHRGQVETRGAIAKRIRKHWENGRMGSSGAFGMLAELEVSVHSDGGG
ncbi:hypothetical protein BD410DRAFT_748792 [Rickenella mellea]|uniref:Pentacotripeptide-repeat region of PRORP domain-containing protein n=1 Tax=Rickenella mellea TaxID=50990 RepID=A0A4Y7Q381_9AGAM|nr:hypothetical protein BD410DRAFT_748792 [Rickenella mellea]